MTELKFDSSWDIETFIDKNIDYYSEKYLEHNPQNAYKINDGDLFLVNEWIYDDIEMVWRDYVRAMFEHMGDRLEKIYFKYGREMSQSDKEHNERQHRYTLGVRDAMRIVSDYMK